MRTSRALAVAFALSASAGGAVAQDKQDTQQKKDDKAAKPAPAAKPKPPARTFTDEDLKKYKADRPKESSPSSEGSRPAESSPVGESGGSGASGESSGGSEQDWRARAAEARRPLEEARGRVSQMEEQLEDLRQMINPMSTRYVLGGNSNAGPGKVLEVQQQIGELETQLPSARQAVVEAEKSWTQFQQEARSAGANPSWLDP